MFTFSVNLLFTSTNFVSVNKGNLLASIVPVEMFENMANEKETSYLTNQVIFKNFLYLESFFVTLLRITKILSLEKHQNSHPAYLFENLI